MTRLYLTRHGETEWNIQGRMQGSKDSPLTELGIKQAMQLGKRLKDTKIDVVYSSPSGRAYNTAKLILGDRKVNIIPMEELMEMNFGIWEGMTFDVIRKEYKEQYDTFWNTPHLLKDFPGESFEQLKLRGVSAVNKIISENEGKDILIVGHALIVKAIMSHFENLPIEKLLDNRFIQPTSLSVVEVEQDRYEIVKYADTAHYDI
ncbi:histidine phosphatase family protein [Clostridium thermarum]|uniref:histidine phosphatase family protein n=1 Tax=Clostridium thermarum TaxID=1716543 RepID=UPI00111CBF84|nr:histidine phosphatase family protein [Clostridium thermarum]